MIGATCSDKTFCFGWLLLVPFCLFTSVKTLYLVPLNISKAGVETLHVQSLMQQQERVGWGKWTGGPHTLFTYSTGQMQ